MHWRVHNLEISFYVKLIKSGIMFVKESGPLFIFFCVIQKFFIYIFKSQLKNLFTERGFHRFPLMSPLSI